MIDSKVNFLVNAVLDTFPGSKIVKDEREKEMNEFESLVKEMRDAQKRYFKARKSKESDALVYAKLDAAKTLEKKVDDKLTGQTTMPFDLG